jgi:hypothetical protein
MIVAILTLIVTLAFAAGPFLFPDFDGFAPERFPVPQFNPPVQPAGYAFGIWGMIYLWLIGSAVFGLIKRRDDPEWNAMRPALIMSAAIGAAWLALAKDNPLIATAMIWAMWLTAVAALFRAPSEDRVWAAWPVGLYAGWLSAASCVATGLCIAGYGLLSNEMTAMAMMSLAIGLSAALQLKVGRAPTFGIAVIWALVAIYAANVVSNAQVAGLAVGGAVGIGALTLFAVFMEWRRDRASAA